MADPVVTQTPDQLPRATDAPPSALTVIQQPGGPVQSIELQKLIGSITNADVVAESKEEAGLAYDAGTTAYFYAPTPPDQAGYWIKHGASGSGSWQFNSAISDLIGQATGPAIALARAWASQDTGPVDDANYPGLVSALASALIAKSWADAASASAGVIRPVAPLLSPMAGDGTVDDDSGGSPFATPVQFFLAIANAAGLPVSAWPFFQDGGVGGNYFRPIFYSMPDDDSGGGGTVTGLALDDGNMPLQFDESWQIYAVLQSRMIGEIGTSLGVGLKSLWRGGAGATDVVVTETLMTARKTDTTAAPNWTGQLVLPRSTTDTYPIGQADRLYVLAAVGQSNGGPAGVNNNSVLTSASFPWHALRGSAGRLLDGDPTHGAAGRTYTVAEQRGFAALNDDAGTAGYIMTNVAFMEQRRARLLGREAVPMVAAYAGYGSVPLNYLRKSESSAQAPKYFYANAQNFLTAKAQDALAFGVRPVPIVLQVQGENVNVPAGETYLDIQYQLIQDHLADTLANTGYELLLYGLLQTNGLSDGTDPQFSSARAHLTCARLMRGTAVVLVAPMYACALAQEGGTTASIHADGPSKMMLADLFNRAIHAKEAGGYRHLDIARVSTPALGVDQVIRAPGVATGTKITGLGTGAGGAGTYTVNTSQTVTSRKFEAFGAIFWGSIDGTTLTVSAIDEGALDVTISGSDVAVRFERDILVDLDRVPTVGPALGFSWACSNSRTITSVTVSGRVATLHLSGAPGTARTLGYADQDCGGAFLHTGQATGSNWAAARGLIYAETGIDSMAWHYHAAGTPTLRDQLVRLQETF